MCGIVVVAVAIAIACTHIHTHTHMLMYFTFDDAFLDAWWDAAADAVKWYTGWFLWQEGRGYEIENVDYGSGCLLLHGTWWYVWTASV